MISILIVNHVLHLLIFSLHLCTADVNLDTYVKKAEVNLRMLTSPKNFPSNEAGVSQNNCLCSACMLVILPAFVWLSCQLYSPLSPIGSLLNKWHFNLLSPVPGVKIIHLDGVEIMHHVFSLYKIWNVCMYILLQKLGLIFSSIAFFLQCYFVIDAEVNDILCLL